MLRFWRELSQPYTSYRCNDSSIDKALLKNELIENEHHLEGDSWHKPSAFSAYHSLCFWTHDCFVASYIIEQVTLQCRLAIQYIGVMSQLISFGTEDNSCQSDCCWLSLQEKIIPLAAVSAEKSEWQSVLLGKCKWSCVQSSLCPDVRDQSSWDLMI